MNKKRIIFYFVEYILIFIIGAVAYMAIEILWRGFTHWTMGILGGIVLILVGLINEADKDIPLMVQAPMASIIITLLEYYSGIILNIHLGLNIWDYSDLPLNVDGQVCLMYSLLWMILGSIAVLLDDFVRWKIFKEPRKKTRLI